MHHNIGIIGSCGKNGKKSNPQSYQRMINLATNSVKHYKDKGFNVILVSGGSALSDHVAVDLYLEGFVDSLILYLPCEWNESKCQFVENSNDPKEDPGKFLNFLHKKFGDEVHKNSLKEIQLAIDKGAKIYTGCGFLSRNIQIANTVDTLIAFTFDTVMTPGTHHTWTHCNIDDKIHILIK
jgi:pyoverdine/dityrosine biosynthesis protein Dit1